MNCGYCNNEFHSIGLHNLFCSPLCRRRARTNRERNLNRTVSQRFCKECQIEIAATERINKIFCNRLCKNEFFAKDPKHKENCSEAGVIKRLIKNIINTSDTGTKTIYAVTGEEILVDANLYNWLNSYRWTLNNKGYANYCRTPMHRLLKTLWGWNGKLCDHIDNNKLNNTRVNLRPATVAQNNCNTPSRNGSKVQYKGVHITASGKYQAMIWYNNKNHNLGSYTTPEEAAIAYNNAAILHQGEYAYLNVIV